MTEKGEASPPQRPQVPADMKAFNRVVVEDHRANHGQMKGPLAGRTVLLLTTTGARSREQRTVVLGYGRHHDSLVVIASNNGAEEHPSWYRNLLADPMATVEVGPEKFQARARTARPQEREELSKTVPYLESQQKLTSREIPIVVLDKVEG
jgi:deazaflavin-dependent oxidoreductase (nitroreductase family)